MVSGRLSPILRHLRRVIPPREGDGVSDAQLLERFVHENDETAFELLLWRHGPMVWTLCRRILPDFHEAEDAFQAAMLVLARKAGSINKRLSVGQLVIQGRFSHCPARSGRLHAPSQVGKGKADAPTPGLYAGPWK